MFIETNILDYEQRRAFIKQDEIVAVIDYKTELYEDIEIVLKSGKTFFTRANYDEFVAKLKTPLLLG